VFGGNDVKVAENVITGVKEVVLGFASLRALGMATKMGVNEALKNEEHRRRLEVDEGGAAEEAGSGGSSEGAARLRKLHDQVKRTMREEHYAMHEIHNHVNTGFKHDTPMPQNPLDYTEQDYVESMMRVAKDYSSAEQDGQLQHVERSLQGHVKRRLFFWFIIIAVVAVVYVAACTKMGAWKTKHLVSAKLKWSSAKRILGMLPEENGLRGAGMKALGILEKKFPEGSEIGVEQDYESEDEVMP
jgi:hypothetical protein